MSVSENGRVFLVGAGCGSYDLITLRGMKILENCDVVVYDSLIDEQLLNFVPENAERICVGKRAGKHSESQENINNILIEKALEGKNVVRLKGGDSFVFGRGGEEILALRERNIEYDVIPGISSCIAVPELAGIPVTHRQLSRSFHVITGHTANDSLPENMQNLARLDCTLVFLMGLSNLELIVKQLMDNGKSADTPVAVISEGATERQHIVRATLENIFEAVKEQKLKAPAIIVVGETAALDFSSSLNLPLKNVSVTVTGTKRFTQKLSSKLEEYGASIKVHSVLKIDEYTENLEFENALNNVKLYDWIVLTSTNGVELFFNRLLKLKLDIRSLAHIKFAVIGSGTSDALEKHGVIASLVPKIYTAENLGVSLCNEVKDDERVLIFRAKQGSEILDEILEKQNIDYSDIKIYDVYSEEQDEPQIINTNFIVFASSSGVHSFYKCGNKISAETKVVCIGEITANTLKKYNAHNFITSKKHDVDGIIDTIMQEV